MAGMKRQTRILIISPMASRIAAWIAEATEDYTVGIHQATTGLTGLESLQRLRPSLALIDCELPDMNGMSLTAIIKGTLKGQDTEVFLFNLREMYPDMKADQLCFHVEEDKLREFLTAQSRLLIEKLELQRRHEDEIIRAKAQQYEFLPEPIDISLVHASYLFSPYGDLSGDGCDFWISDKVPERLYGFVFDCTGHDIMSFSQCSEFRMLLKKNLKLNEVQFHESLSEAMHSINTDLFEIDRDPPTAAAISFYLDMKEMTFHYASAGINIVLRRARGEVDYEKVPTYSSPFGYDPDTEYVDEFFDASGLDRIIIPTDGFTEVMVPKGEELPKQNIAKHDDVTAIFLGIKQNKIREGNKT